MKPSVIPLLAVVLVSAGCAASVTVSVAPSAPIASSPVPGPTSSTTPTASPTPTAAPANALPRLVFDSVEQARGTVGRMHLDLHFVVTRHLTISYQPGTVLAQRPPAGTLMKRNRTVYVTASAAPPCDPSYPTVCIPPFKGHLMCPDITFRNFVVRPPDTYHFDRDHNGIGCPHVIKPPKPPKSPSPSG